MLVKTADGWTSTDWSTYTVIHVVNTQGACIFSPASFFGYGEANISAILESLLLLLFIYLFMQTYYII